MSVTTIDTSVSGIVVVKVPAAINDDAQILSKLKNMQGAGGYSFADFGNNQALVDYLVSRHELYKVIVTGNPSQGDLIFILNDMNGILSAYAPMISGPYPGDLTGLRDDVAAVLGM
jgi:hypothetical protein